MFDLDKLLDEAVLEATLSVGRAPRLVARHYGAAATATAVGGQAAVRFDGYANVWSAEDEAFLREWAGELGKEELARRLGRSVAAVKVRSARKGLVAPTKHPDYITARGAARALGVEKKAVCKWIERGMLAAELAPLADRKVWRIRRSVFAAWALRPANWVYFIRSVRRPERIRDEALRRLIARRAAVWGDEWWTTEQVAEYHRVHHKDVARYIYAGRLPATQWGNWYVLRSEATRPGLRFYKGKGGSRFEYTGTPAGNAFVVLATAVGIPAGQIARLRGRGTSEGVASRYRAIVRHGLAPWLIRAYGLPVEPRGGRLWADWRPLGYRFPGLARAWGKLARGEGIDWQERMLLKGVLGAFMRGHYPDEELTRRLGRNGTARTDDLVAAAGLYESWGTTANSSEVAASAATASL